MVIYKKSVTEPVDGKNQAEEKYYDESVLHETCPTLAIASRTGCSGPDTEMDIFERRRALQHQKTRTVDVREMAIELGIPG